MLDHLVYAVPDLEAACDDLEARLGVRPSPGGQHAGRGTYNALLDLGGKAYIEVIAPDPSQPQPSRPRGFDLDHPAPPRLFTWAAKATDLEQRVATAKAAGYDAGEAQPLSRQRPDGVLLEWMLTVRKGFEAGGLVPFLIDWGDAPHPSETAAQGCTLVEYHGEHPDSASVAPLLAALGVELRIDEGATAALVATLDTPLGRVELR